MRHFNFCFLLFLGWGQRILAQEVTEDAPSVVTQEAFGPLFTKMIFLLGSLMAILLVAAWAMKRVMASRWQSSNGDSSIQIIERRMLHTKAGLYLIQVENQKMLAVESPSGFQSLGQWTAEPLNSESKNG